MTANFIMPSWARRPFRTLVSPAWWPGNSWKKLPADKPRVYRNALVLAVPSEDGLEVARNRIKDHLGWEEVQFQLKDRKLDPIRADTLVGEIEKSRKSIPEAIQQAYCLVVTVSEKNEIPGF